ncbi:hypothetical protein C7B76_25060 [filamentous cyanobacterium CCP2]|nr:hypothetical protein C7B76_25060 [filamentous cyanobacterium CCP2]
MNPKMHYYNDRPSPDAKASARVPLRLSASLWRLNVLTMQAKLASASTLNELLLPRTRRGWFV